MTRPLTKSVPPRDPRSSQSTDPARFPLATGPTPLQRLAAVEEICGTGPLLIKRDDLTGFAAAGNKARALEYLLGDALTRGADLLVTGGRPGSNFCSAAAAAAAKAGLEAHLVMAVPPHTWSTNLSLSLAWGARITTVPEGTDLDAAITAHGAMLRAAGRRVYTVPRGGATPVGALGYAEAAHELAGQLAEQASEPLNVVVAVGTGGTVAGLLTGRGELGAAWSLAGVCVSTPAAHMASRITQIAAGCAALRGVRPGSGLTLTDADGTHGVLTARQAELAELALRHEGLLLDGTYTAKSFERAVTLARGSSRPTVFWHTGGIIGALDRLAREHPPTDLEPAASSPEPTMSAEESPT
jgi:1-aminocyclopropane-1-carboxylate deaminase/D-cysteine desulfhydrase-like pyridoxal-dependent ACC family enzyme